MRRVTISFCILPLFSILSNCGVASIDEPGLGTIQQRVVQCPPPAEGTANICDQGDGRIKVQATLPQGQAYVEVFLRKNGIQDTAIEIASSEQKNLDGKTSVYSIVRDSYKTGDRVEYRFYSYRPGSPALFTPGPEEHQWGQYVYGPDGVPSTRFVVDQPIDSTHGSCKANADSSGQCNLRAAIAEAQKAKGTVIIQVAVDSAIDKGEMAITGSDDTARYQLAIEGKDGAKTVSSKGYGRLFRVSTNTTLMLTNITVQDFSVYDQTGGAAILNYGNVEVRKTSFINNKSSYSGGGAMTAFATCSGGAVSNYGRLTLREGTRFDNNSVSAESYTASFTHANAYGGAIASFGSIIIAGHVTFTNNTASATSMAGYHPMPGGASADSAGGAIYNSNGTIVFEEPSSRKCSFTRNSARASATAPDDESHGPRTVTMNSRGGAIFSQGGSALFAAEACAFQDNTAQQDPELYLAPSRPNVN